MLSEYVQDSKGGGGEASRTEALAKVSRAYPNPNPNPNLNPNPSPNPNPNPNQVAAAVAELLRLKALLPQE